MNFVNDATLLKMAEVELLKEAKRAVERQMTLGISGWKPAPKTNKLFLTNTVLQVLASNKILSKKYENKIQGKSSTKKKEKERKLLQPKEKKSHNYVFKKPDQKMSQIKHFSSKNIEKSSKSTLHSKKISFKNNQHKVKSVKNN